MNLLAKIAASTAVSVTAALALLGNSAMAFTVTQNSNTNSLLNALLGDTTGLSNFSINATGNAAAFGLFSDDPFGLNQGIVLSTGKVIDVVGPNNTSSKGTDLGSGGSAGDLAQLDISFDAGATVDKLFFQYVFGSEEFVEWGGSSFNDSFELLLNGVNLAKLNDGKTVTINNLVPNPNGPYHADYINNPQGSASTQLDGYTKTLTFEGLVNKNATNTLSIKIKDVGDGIYDSAVFIKGKSVGVVAPPKDVPEPSLMLGLLSVGGMTLMSRRHKQKALKA
ncbi:MULTISPECIES: choice-of-anchor L domain-containing protein [unclassified Coleofasciculus]|uniref:choice-of-anchor L family PEP-CTERM protein n=1 Tax=Cyanophyceae TaxID=3028117 RepID=UPI00168284B4|nr:MULTISPECIES: choice-of-anchor L domain-containing protein [unclassified Coleofasciculus]MBD1878648.1 choice-of-anchor L domain-containing protein [Coleofasciculus sp. FACHB-T130]MBD2540441.1 choice-of-anchor L domain-containing protein [Coleofasciculus sp. FACHB-SPT36]